MPVFFHKTAVAEPLTLLVAVYPQAIYLGSISVNAFAWYAPGTEPTGSYQLSQDDDGDVIYLNGDDAAEFAAE